MNKKLPIALGVLMFLSLPFAPVFGQRMTKVVEKKHSNGKPEIVKYYRGAKSESNLSKTEVFAIDGQKVREENYLNGRLHGKVLEWKEFDGTKEMELNYVEGKLEGQQTYFFSDGRPKIALNYLGGKLDGRQVEFWFKEETEGLKAEHNYSGGILHGMQRKWLPDGGKEYHYNFVAGKPDGIQRMWTPAGKTSQETWKQGTFEEVVEAWTAAQPKHTRVYDFKLEGDSLDVKLGKELQKEVHYYESGALKAITVMTDPPETQVFHPNSKLKGKGKGTLEKKQGKWEFWHMNGQKMREGEYADGAPKGLIQSWDENGNLVSEEVWEPGGKARSSWKVFLYHDNGKKAGEGNLDEGGRKKGLWKYWYANGNKEREETWEMACKSGEGRPFVTDLKVWDESGKLLVKGNEADQKQYEYFPNGNVMRIQTVVFPDRGPCDDAAAEVYKEGRMVLESKAAPSGKSAVVEDIEFFEHGDTMRIARFDQQGRRDGYQEGWYANGNKHYEYHYLEGRVQGTVREWYNSGQMMLDHKYKSAVGGPPRLVEGTYYNDRGKDYFYSNSDKKKKNVMEDIDESCYFSKFWVENQ